MRNKETGEFELVVGNGQLVSGFFIVVLLFAVGVAMGYILGQNSEKAAKNQPGDATPCVATDGRPQPSQPATQPVATQPAPATDAQPQGGQDAPPQPTAQPTTQPAREPAPSTQPATPEPVKPAPPSPPPAKSTAAASAEAPPGWFWQVTATSNQESARATLKILQDRGFSAYLSPGPNNLTRVLVGPYSDTPSKSKAKTEIEGMGLGKPVSHTVHPRE